MTAEAPRPRRRRRAVGPPGAPDPQPVADPRDRPDERRDTGADERLVADRPPHHDRP